MNTFLYNGKNNLKQDTLDELAFAYQRYFRINQDKILKVDLFALLNCLLLSIYMDSIVLLPSKGSMIIF